MANNVPPKAPPATAAKPGAAPAAAKPGAAPKKKLSLDFSDTSDVLERKISP
jgi:hypothetical protein